MPDNNEIRRAAGRMNRKWGLRPLPVKVVEGQKHPYLKWTRYVQSYTFLELASEFQPDRGLWTAVGRTTGYVILDCDNDAAIRLWRERLADMFDRTGAARTRKGIHLWWSVATFADDPDAPPIPSWSHQRDPEALDRGACYDIRADGTGVMLPPSRHPDDLSFRYEWIRTPDAALPAPDLLLQPWDERGGIGGVESGKSKRTKGTAKNGRSILAQLLLNPADEGGRNTWHNKVSGHMAKYVPFVDAFEALGLALNSAMPDPQDEDEVLKTWRSAWNTERQERGAEMGTVETGYLSGSGSEMFTVIRRPVGKEQFVEEPAHWANADVIANGVIDGPGGRIYVVTIQRKDGLVHTDQIEPGLLGSATDTARWLARHGVSVMVPFQELPAASRIGHDGERMLRYLESQKPDQYRSITHLGWHDRIGFVTHEGIISAAGMRPLEGVMPDRQLEELAPYHYGMSDPDEARRVLREVLTFQDPEVAAVTGAWWAATFLKGQIMERIGHFPYLKINAASESGKTRGLFSLLRTLAGSTKIGIGTKASTRDAIGAHRNGIVHIDDPDDVDHLAELLRAATGESIITKKAPDNRGTIEVKMVAPILLSGESLGLDAEKAQRDRSISLDVGSPVNRMSLHDPKRPQIDDIKTLEREHPDMTVFAGTLVQMALQQEYLLDQLPALRGPAGRHNELLAIIRVGARALAAMVSGDDYDDSWITERADAWCDRQTDRGASNTVIEQVIPWALTDERWRVKGTSIGAPPAYLDREGQLWVCVPRLAAEWQKECARRGVRDRLANEAAIRAQIRALGSCRSEQKWVTSRTERDGGKQMRRARYECIPADYAAMILGDLPREATEGREEPIMPPKG